MLFNSYEFGVFFLLVTALFFLAPVLPAPAFLCMGAAVAGLVCAHLDMPLALTAGAVLAPLLLLPLGRRLGAVQLQWILLLAASCVFYLYAIPIYLLVLAALIGVDYAAGLAIEATQGRRRTLCLVSSLVSNLGVLFVFKYFDFVTGNLQALAHALDWNYPVTVLSLALPIGLSFHTFQAMAYTLEVYMGRQAAERHLGRYALYVMFYPQLVAGPIERPQHMLHQFREVHRFEAERVIAGLQLMAWGLFKKVVIADRLAVVVTAVFAAPEQFGGASLLLAVYFFTFQIFCDFSGYSDIATGAAQVMGFQLMRNFDRPYFSRSVGEFWRRWHISLSTWFRDYLYIPLGGNRVALPRRVMNLLVVFLVSGLWHGAKWTFVAWGALHGLYVVMEILTAGPRRTLMEAASRLVGGEERLRPLWGFLGWLVTFHLVALAWIFFRAASLPQAWFVVSHLFTGLEWRYDYRIGLTQIELGIAICTIGLMEGIHLAQRGGSLRARLAGMPLMIRWSLYYILTLLIALFGVFNEQDFIYFQF